MEGPRINRSASCLSPTLAGVVAIQMKLEFVLRVCGVGRALANAEKNGVMLGGTGAWGSALALSLVVIVNLASHLHFGPQLG